MTLFALTLGGIIISLLAVFPGFAIHADATPVVYSGPLDHTYDLMIGNQRYPIRYGILGNGTIENMSANSSSKSITVIINDNNTSADIKGGQGGLLAIQLPRKIIDANATETAGGCSAKSSTQGYWTQEHDIRYHAFVNGLPAGLAEPSGLFEGTYAFGGEQCERDSRTLTVYYPTGKSTIIIQGTAMIPELGSMLSIWIMTIGIIGIIGVRFSIGHISRNSRRTPDFQPR